MKDKTSLIFFIVVFSLTLQQRTEAQTVVRHSVVSNGGNVTSNSQFRIVGTVGRPAIGIGIANNGTNNLASGFWSLPINLITNVEEIPSAVVPREFRLDQNFPNPFNPSTTIQFAVPRTADVTVKLFDLLGREVATLVDEEFASGEYKLLFEAGELASGVYFYRIVGKTTSGTAERFVSTKKLMLLK